MTPTALSLNFYGPLVDGRPSRVMVETTRHSNKKFVDLHDPYDCRLSPPIESVVEKTLLGISQSQSIEPRVNLGTTQLPDPFLLHLNFAILAFNSPGNGWPKVIQMPLKSDLHEGECWGCKEDCAFVRMSGQIKQALQSKPHREVHFIPETEEEPEPVVDSSWTWSQLLAALALVLLSVGVVALLTQQKSPGIYYRVWKAAQKSH